MFFQYLNQTPWIFSQPWDSRPQSSSLDAPLSYPCLCLGTPFGAFKKRSVWGCTSKVSGRIPSVSCYQSFSVSSEASMGFAYGTSKDLSTSAPNVLIDELSFKDDPNQITRTLSFGSSTMVSKNKGIQVTLRERFIQRLIVDGKKSIATKIFDESLELLKDRIQQYNLSTDSRGKSENLYSLATLTKDEIFIIALRKAQPWITTSSLRRGGKKVIIPEMLTAAQQESIAIRWLILNSRTTTGKSMAESLASELFGCLTNQGKTINQREQLHKLAEANRAWAN